MSSHFVGRDLTPEEWRRSEQIKREAHRLSDRLDNLKEEAEQLKVQLRHWHGVFDRLVGDNGKVRVQ